MIINDLISTNPKDRIIIINGNRNKRKVSKIVKSRNDFDVGWLTLKGRKEGRKEV